MIIKPVILSLKVATIATIITLIIGIILARVFTKYNFKFKRGVEILILLPMVLPPSVIGYGLLKIIGRGGLIGGFLYENFDITLVFNWIAACIAAVVVSLPLMYQNCKTGFENINNSYEKVARTLGATENIIFWKITIPIALPNILTGTILAFARAVGEFGATLMVAGNIPGKTQTIPLAIFFAVDRGDIRSANILMGITIIFSFSIIYILNRWVGSKE
ncbi:molybdate ABC transporter permease subunit [Dethiothermospora halolimnae]|uniref:molybdate ABC transporter permease subunit n=1 Tax=Dethiothermospora halolimnae TaxID=3114390 RepID=UPI003CCBD046